MARENLPLISAGTYHGLLTENPNDFIDKYEIAAKSNNWQDASKINLFPAHLAGTALAWYQHYSKGQEINNWENLKTTFISTFTPAAQAQTIQAVLEKKVQGRDQPVLTYYLEILTLCRRHDPNTPDKTIIHHIIQGLRPEFCERILTETCETLAQLEENLKKIEIQMEIRAANREKYNRAEQTGSNRGLVENNRQDFNNLQAEIKNLTQVISNMNIQQPSPQPRPQLHTQDPNRAYYNQHRGSSFRGATYRPSHQQRTAPMQWRPERTTPHRGAYQSHFRPQWNPRYQSYATRPYSSTHTYRGGDIYCNVCHKTNHRTQDCRYKTPQAQTNSQQRSKYCDYCDMKNHNREECFRLKNAQHKKKN